MSHTLRGRHWLLGSILSVSLLGACAPEDEGAPTEITETHAVDQELSGGTDLRNIQVNVSAKAGLITAAEPAEITVTLRNSGRSTAKVLRWFTPAEGLEEPIFKVTRDGAEVQYVGAHYKRPPTTDADYVKLAAGESVTWKVDLAETYDLSQTGEYKIQLSVGPLRSIELKATIEGRKSGPSAPAPDVGTASLSYSRCDASQSNLVAQAVSNASTYANTASTYLNGTPSATPRYTTWFGAYSSSGWNTAKSHFAAIKDAFDTKPVTVDCSCKKRYYAYVYPNQPYIIYVCSVFWQAPMTGTDSKAGTLIHEMSHFSVVAGTDDWAYGQSAAKSLASSDPNKALNNADNHEYFAENTPFQN